MRTKIAFLTLVASLFFIPQSFAGVLIEPYLGYHLGKTTQTGSPSSNDKGVSYGARLGYQSLGFMVGADYLSGSWTDDSTPKDTITPANLGAFVGYNFPMMIRVYGTYFFSSDTKASSSSGSLRYKGTGFRLGVGFHLIPMVSVNVEYGMMTDDKYDSSTYSGLPTSGTLSDKVNTNFYGLTVSVPFNLL